MLEIRGKWMIRTYRSGKVIEKSKFWVPEQTKRRSPKKASSSKRKQDENERDSVKALARIINCNFSHGDLWLTLNYSAKGMDKLIALAGSDDIDAIKEAADKELRLFLRRMKRELAKQGVELKYIALTSDMDGKTGKLVRPHHHIIMPRICYEACQKQWQRNGGVDYQLLRDQSDYTPLAAYLVKQCRRQANEKRWKSSRNLARPVITEEETHKKGMLHAPAGAQIKDSGHYDDESGNHYIRYIPRKRVKRGGHKETARGDRLGVS